MCKFTGDFNYKTPLCQTIELGLECLFILPKCVLHVYPLVTSRPMQK
jgi:hypothetical protein